jgi:hypothetical protein
MENYFNGDLEEAAWNRTTPTVDFSPDPKVKKR